MAKQVQIFVCMILTCWIFSASASICNANRTFWNPVSLQCQVDCSNFGVNDCGAGDCISTSFYVGNTCIDCKVMAVTTYIQNYINSTNFRAHCTCWGKYWNRQTLMCEDNCKNFNYINCGQGDCNYISFYKNLTCIDCRIMPRNRSPYRLQNQYNQYNQYQCSCLSHWNSQTLKCENCSTMPANLCGFNDCRSISFFTGSTCIDCTETSITTFLSTTNYSNVSKICRCWKKYWNPTSAQCEDNCTNFSSDFCAKNNCAHISYFDATQQICVDCRAIAGTYFNRFGNFCECKGQMYNPSTLRCEMNCSGFNMKDCGRGTCKDRSFLVGNTCIDCSIVSSTAYSQLYGDQNLSTHCSCWKMFWNPTTIMCERNCTNLNQNDCGKGDCSMISFYINGSCLDCRSQQNTKSNVIRNRQDTNFQCQCYSSFKWNPMNLQCELNCQNFSSSDCADGDCFQISFYNPNSNICVDCLSKSKTNQTQVIKTNLENTGSQCSCLTDLFWNPTTNECEMNCTNLNQNDCGKGDCANISFFSGSTCIDCSKLAYNSNGETTLNGFQERMQCECRSSYCWNAQQLRCQRQNCPLTSKAVGMIISILVGSCLLVLFVLLMKFTRLGRRCKRLCCSCLKSEKAEMREIHDGNNDDVTNQTIVSQTGTENKETKSDCAICLDSEPDVILHCFFQDKTTQRVYQLDNMHMFHRKCILQQRQRRRICPTCRSKQNRSVTVYCICKQNKRRIPINQLQNQFYCQDCSRNRL